MDNRRSVRRFQSGTWQSGSNGRPYRTQVTLWDLSSMRSRYNRGPWQITCLAAAMEARNLPAPYVKKFNTPAV
ncbi:unnamed protein product [Staurois parvus]|uniref:Uncharacterized protein n=1 Tax=Staurois parvus TaxID=386267 RepID=A0ABN9C1M6_9NEOB|nr:unnamed protein product [Staurois parvus]